MAAGFTLTDATLRSSRAYRCPVTDASKIPFAGSRV